MAKYKKKKYIFEFWSKESTEVCIQATSIKEAERIFNDMLQKEIIDLSSTHYEASGIRYLRIDKTNKKLAENE